MRAWRNSTDGPIDAAAALDAGGCHLRVNPAALVLRSKGPDVHRVWDRDESAWPPVCDLEAFEAWFEIDTRSMVRALDDSGLEHEDDGPSVSARLALLLPGSRTATKPPPGCQAQRWLP